MMTNNNDFEEKSLKIIKISFFSKVTLTTTTTTKTAGMLATEVRIGDAPKPPFPIKSIEIKKIRKSTP